MADLAIFQSSNAGSNTHKNTSNSLSGFLSTLVPVAAEATLFVAIFLVMRTKEQRVYRPRTYLRTLRDQLVESLVGLGAIIDRLHREKSQDLPQGKFNWLGSFRSIPDEYVLNHQSLDGYLYLRFLKMLTVICLFGACLTFPVLFPVNATGGGGQTQLDILSFSNISNNGKNRYYAHVFTGWVFFSMVNSAPHQLPKANCGRLCHVDYHSRDGLLH